MRLLASLAVVAILCVACAGGGPDISGDLRNVGPVTVTFKVAPARVRVGQAVRFTLRLVNNVGRKAELTFPSGQRYDFWATLDGREAWRWSDERVFVAAITRESIPPQSGTSYAEVWRPTRSGRYAVHGELKAKGYRGELSGTLDVG